ncbi:hypothetical protein P8610_05145 [Fictibacillus sp. UD]|uniref:hypothetical protein n=1 Tax=Fictibacillus sp. UD TaxID=3038777 RepID=UPI00374510A5
MAKMVFERESQFANKWRKFDIYINDNKRENIKDGETKQIDVEPGEYIVKMQIDWVESATHKVQVKQDETIHFQCGSRLKGWKILKASSAMNTVDEFVYLEKK